MPDIFIVMSTDGDIQAVFDSEEKAEAERQYLADLGEDELDWLPLDESKIVKAGELNYSFMGAHR